MIFVVEVPDQADPSAWFAFDLDDLLRKIEQRAPGGWETTSGEAWKSGADIAWAFILSERGTLIRNGPMIIDPRLVGAGPERSAEQACSPIRDGIGSSRS